MSCIINKEKQKQCTISFAAIKQYLPYVWYQTAGICVICDGHQVVEFGEVDDAPIASLWIFLVHSPLDAGRKSMVPNYVVPAVAVAGLQGRRSHHVNAFHENDEFSISILEEGLDFSLRGGLGLDGGLLVVTDCVLSSPAH